MVSSCGRYVLVYNGEIYNAAELRRDLEAAGRTFRGHCDSEVLVEACGALGLSATLARLLGMFAFALWDRENRSLSLVRDRLGVKPFYWGAAGGLVLFGSELKALVAHGGWSPEIDRDSLASYMRHMVVPAPASIYRGIHKLEPGQVVTIDSAGTPTTSRYWDLRTVARDTPRADVGEAEALDCLSSLLGDSVGRRMVADVVIRVEEFPDDDVIKEMALPSPFDLLGLYQGVSLDLKSMMNTPEQVDIILLYRRPLLDYWCESGDRLAHLVRHVLIHEIGHHFGFSDAEMEAIEADDGFEKRRNA